MQSAKARCAIVTDIESVWQTLLPGLEKLHASSDTQDWTIAEIRKMLDDEEGVLIMDVEEPTAFAIIFVQSSPYAPDDLELFLHLAWHPGGDAFMRFEPLLEYAARKVNAKSMRFYSRRHGMLKLATRMGYLARSVEYVKEL